MEKTPKMKKQMNPETKKQIIGISIGVLSMIVLAVLVIVAYIITYKHVKKPNDFDAYYGVGYQEKIVLDDQAGEVKYLTYEVKGSLANGIIYEGEMKHSFDPGNGAISGFIGIKLAVKEDGTILGYSYTKYDHTPDKAYKGKVDDYLDALVGTNLKDLETTHADISSKYGGASETGNVVYEILKTFKGVAK